jgi:hypothetical protein
VCHRLLFGDNRRRRNRFEEGTLGEARACLAWGDEFAGRGDEAGGQRPRGLDDSIFERVGEVRLGHPVRKMDRCMGFGRSGARARQGIDADGIAQEVGLTGLGQWVCGCCRRGSFLDDGELFWFGFVFGRSAGGCGQGIDGRLGGGLRGERLAPGGKPGVAFGNAGGNRIGRGYFFEAGQGRLMGGSAAAVGANASRDFVLPGGYGCAGGLTRGGVRV